MVKDQKQLNSLLRKAEGELNPTGAMVHELSEQTDILNDIKKSTVDKPTVQVVGLDVITLKDGKVKAILIEHLRERLIKNTGVYEWVAPIHETLIEKSLPKRLMTSAVMCFTYQLEIVCSLLLIETLKPLNI